MNSTGTPELARLRAQSDRPPVRRGARCGPPRRPRSPRTSEPPCASEPARTAKRIGTKDRCLIQFRTSS
ncbi:hypothetical protein FK530_21335 [Tsukamurella conjunctivitidis]|uniref:Uncharacterized protein n=1 Tax=Tsukamurella conjunctivitidis TaxID=2592068 RepID=A0A5C5RWP3_9ACTN|nr:hypothetical protein FK530_21335 [Tsukamurella conjunctivitidis]